MNSSATKTLTTAAAVAAVAILAVGCTAAAPKVDVDQVRAEAMAQVDGLDYLNSKDEALRDINRSIDPDEIRNYARVAVEENAERKAVYWECAAGVPELLPGAWSTSGQTATPLEGQERSGNMYLLVTRPDKTSTLTIEGTGWWLSDQPQTELESWLETAAGNVTGWASDLDQVIANQDYRATAPPNAVSRNGCDVRFTLTLDAAPERAFEARFVRSGGERYLVLDDALQLDPEE
jgi:hypothetical protein